MNVDDSLNSNLDSRRQKKVAKKFAIYENGIYIMP